MPAGLVRSGDFRNGTPVVLPHNFGNVVAGKNQPFGNVEPQSNPDMAGNNVTWLPSPAHFGNQVSFGLQSVPPILVVAPASTGTVNMNLTNLLGTNSATLTYFGNPAGVSLAFAPNPDTSSSVVTVTVGAGVAAGKYTITIVGTVSSPNIEYAQLTLIVAGAVAGAPPTFTSITPSTGTFAGGTPFTIVGTNFITGATVSIGGAPATSIVVVDGQHITGVSPAGTAGVTDVSITTSFGTIDTPSAWTYTAGTIAFVNSGVVRNGSLAGLNSNLVLNYSSTGGNTLLLFIEIDQNADSPINSVIDNNGHSWTNLINASAASNANAYSVYVLENAAAITSVTIQMAGVASGVISVFAGVAEYSGVGSIGTQNFYFVPNFSGIGGSGSPYTQSATLNSAGNFLVNVFSIANTASTNPTSVTGHLRVAQSYDLASGHVTTNGTAVTYVSGAHFVTGGAWTGLPININGTNFTISVVNSATSLTLTTSAGVLTNKTYSFSFFGGAAVAVSDNTAASQSSVTNAVAISGLSSLWGGFGIELIAGGNPTPPQVDSSTPNSGSAAGGTPITILGAGFVTGATVAIFDEVTSITTPCTSVVFVNSGEITCVTPAGTSSDQCDIIVTLPNGTFGGAGDGAWSYT